MATEMMSLPSITLERDTQDLLITAGAGAVTFVVADTWLEFMFLDEQDMPKENADYYRAAVAGVGGYAAGKIASGQKGHAKNALIGVQVALLSVAGQRLLKALDWNHRIEKFATPKRFRSTADGGEGHSVVPRPASTTQQLRTGYASPRLPAGRNNNQRSRASDGVSVIFE